MNPRALTISDATAIAELWLVGAHESASVNNSFRPRISAAQYSASIEEELRSGSCIGWGVFNEEDYLLGYLTARVSQPSVEFEQTAFLYLLDLDVRASYRRQGIGSLLVSQARQYAAKHALSSIEVSWLSADPRASGFWQEQGFSPYLARAQLAVKPKPETQ